MSTRDLKPKGIPYSIDEYDRHLLLNLNVIDDVQEHFDMPLVDITTMLKNDKERYRAVRYLLYAFLADDAEENGYPVISEKSIGRKLTLENLPEAVKAISEAIVEGSPKRATDVENFEAENGEVEKN